MLTYDAEFQATDPTTEVCAKDVNNPAGESTVGVDRLDNSESSCLFEFVTAERSNTQFVTTMYHSISGMKHRMLLLLFVFPLGGLSWAEPRSSATDQDIKLWSVRWFTGAKMKPSAPITLKNAKLHLLSLPEKQLAAQLKAIQRSTQVSIEYSAVSFVLAYLGEDTVLNTRRMLAYVNNGPEALEFRRNRDMQHPIYSWVGDDPIYGLWSSTPFLYGHRRKLDVMYEILRVQSDGEGGYFTADMNRILLFSYPHDYLAVVKAHHMGTFCGEQLAMECGWELRRRVRRVLSESSNGESNATISQLRRSFEENLVGS